MNGAVKEKDREISQIRAQLGKGVASGVEKMAQIRERHHKILQASKKPRDKHVTANRIGSALRSISKDLSEVEKDYAKLAKQLVTLTELLDGRRDLLLRDCLELHRLLESSNAYGNMQRIRGFDEPVGGQSLMDSFTTWIPK